MTVASTVRQAGPFIGDSLATVFPFAFKCFIKTDLVVTLTVIASGVQSTLLVDSDYVVALNADQDATPGGSITYNPLGVPMPATLNLTITSAVPQTQTLTLNLGGGFFPKVISDALDRITILVQELTLKITRGLYVAIGDTVPGTLPSAAARALKFLAFDGSGNPIASAGGASSPVSGAMAPVVAGATLAAARTAMGVAASGANADITSVGAITGVTAAAGDNSTKLATTAFVTTAAGHGQCQLSKSGANLLLLPKNGNLLKVNSALAAVPDAGVTLAVGAALREGGIPVANTTYFIYAKVAAGVMSLIASATGHHAQAGTGVETCTADDTLTLVGMARTSAAPAWVDSVTQRFTISYYNRRNIGGANNFTVDRTTASAAYTEINSEIRSEFVTWGDEACVLGISGSAFNGTAANRTFSGISVDAGGLVQEGMNSQTTVAGSVNWPLGVSLVKTLAEGYHFCSIIGAAPDGGTSTWRGGAGAGTQACFTTVGIRG